MTPLTFSEARATVLAQLHKAQKTPQQCHIDLEKALLRVLSADLAADRDYPPVARSVRDGFAIQSNDLPGEVEVIGEIRAGEPPGRPVGPGQAIEIMTGAQIPAGADAVVMVEHVQRKENKIVTDRNPKPGEFINPAGAEVRQGTTVLTAGTVLTYPRIAMAATLGAASVPVFAKPTVSIVTTGDEVIPLDGIPLPYQVRNSNAYSIAAQVSRAGGEPKILPVAKDVYEDTRRLIEQGLESDLLLLSGGVSAGKYDIVEQVLADLGAEFFFTRVLIQPGQPLVFGQARGTFFFGLPGNPVSTMVTFEVFARAAVELLGGVKEPQLPFTYALLTEPFRHKPGLTRFLPARLSPGGYELTPIRWQGSSDVVALSKANAFLIADSGRESWDAGDRIGVLLQ